MMSETPGYMTTASELPVPVVEAPPPPRSDKKIFRMNGEDFFIAASSEYEAREFYVIRANDLGASIVIDDVTAEELTEQQVHDLEYSRHENEAGEIVIVTFRRHLDIIDAAGAAFPMVFKD